MRCFASKCDLLCLRVFLCGLCVMLPLSGVCAQDAIAPISQFKKQVQESPDHPFHQLEEILTAGEIVQEAGRIVSKKAPAQVLTIPALKTRIGAQIPAGELAAALEDPFDAQRLVQTLKKDPFLKKLFEKPSGYWNKKPLPYTLQQHTLSVLGQFEKYFVDRPLPGGVSKSLFRLLLVLHDIGKPLTEGQEDTSRQYEYTPQVIEALRASLPFDSKDIDLILALIQADCIGSYLRGKVPLADAVERIRQACSTTRYALKDFFELLTIFYQSDTVSYTREAGYRSDWLAGLFRYDPEQSRFAFHATKNRLAFSTEPVRASPDRTSSQPIRGTHHVSGTASQKAIKPHEKIGSRHVSPEPRGVAGSEDFRNNYYAQKLFDFLSQNDDIPEGVVDLIFVPGSSYLESCGLSAELYRKLKSRASVEAGRRPKPLILVSGNASVRKDDFNETEILREKVRNSVYRDKVTRWETEAGIMRDVLVNHYSIPPEDILIESDSMNSRANIAMSRELLERPPGIDHKSVIIVKHPLMQRRTKATFAKVFEDDKDVVSYAYTPRVPDIFKMSAEEKRYFIPVAVAEIRNIPKYAGKGDIAQVDIPSGVSAACDALEELQRQGILPDPFKMTRPAAPVPSHLPFEAEAKGADGFIRETGIIETSN